MLDEHDYTRVEFDWLATDLDGFVGYFSTAGAGPVPTASVQDGELLEDALDRIRALDRVCDGVPVAGVLNPRDWIDVAERGIFAYDWSHTTRQYELVAEPARPVRLHDLLDPKIRSLAAHVRLPVRISMSRQVPPDLDVE